MFVVRLSELAFEDLRKLKRFAQRKVADQMTAQLEQDPVLETRRRKPLDPGDIPGWEHVPPVWELRVGDYRVFYDVDVSSRTVHVRAIRLKGRKTTKEVL
jgi:mRNA-degrading endonuclease RelE of RelBE toxin-antitoxin system